MMQTGLRSAVLLPHSSHESDLKYVLQGGIHGPQSWSAGEIWNQQTGSDADHAKIIRRTDVDIAVRGPLDLSPRIGCGFVVQF